MKMKICSSVHPFAMLGALGLLIAPAAAQEELHQLLPADGAAGDRFGTTVAMTGNLALVGAVGDADYGYHTGSLYVFDAVTGQELRKLLPADVDGGDGFSGGLAADGPFALAGSPGDDYNGTYSGSAYVFDVTTGQELRKLLPSDGQSGDHFGSRVAIHGSIGVIGAYLSDHNGFDSGSAYVFDLTTGQQLFLLLPSVGAPFDHFGDSVGVNQSRVAVGAPLDELNGEYFGAVYVFDLATGQELFKLQPPWSASNPKPHFGTSLAISGDRLLVGADKDSSAADNAGAAYRYDLATGTLLHLLLPEDPSFDRRFGSSVAIDGDRAVVGAEADFALGPYSGSAYVFETVSGRQLFKVLPSDGASRDYFGSAAAIHGGRALVGAATSDVLGTDSGSAYVFSASPSGTEFCSGDPGSGTPCPCGNDHDGSIPGSGCANGVFASGAHLTSFGTASVTDDSLVLFATHAEPGNTGLYFQAESDLSPGVIWGDGLRCAGPDLLRLQTVFADSAGFSRTTIGIAAEAGNVLPGDTKRYQYIYRTRVAPPCGSGVNDFNLSNGYEITWLP